MIFNYTDTFTTVKCNMIERRELRRLLATKVEGYVFSPKYKRGLWDGTISLLDKSNKFPSGLINYVVTELTKLNYECIVNGMNHTALDLQNVIGFTPRDYQIEAGLIGLQLGRGTFKMATNAGKTLLMAMLIKSTGNKGVVIVPNTTLLHQTAGDLSNMLDTDIGKYGDGNTTVSDVTVTTMASLKAVTKLVKPDNQIVCCDETHHAKASTVFDNIFNIPGKFRFGFSGTPLTYDKLSDLKLVGATGDIIYEVTNKQLIEQSYSTPPLIRFVTIPEPVIPSKNADYNTVYQLGIVCNSYRNISIVNLANTERNRGPVLIICNWIEHVDAIVRESEYKFLSATGKSSTYEIQSILSDFTGDKVLVVSPIFGEGVNMPDVATIILASGQKSHIQLLQRIGRGLRKSDKKEVVHIYDFIDAGNKYLLNHSQQRYELYKYEGFPIEMVR